MRTEAQALSLGRQVVACPALHLRGLMTHHGNLTAFQPIIQAFRNAFGQVQALSRVQHGCPSAPLQQVETLLQRRPCLTAEPLSAPATE